MTRLNRRRELLNWVGMFGAPAFLIAAALNASCAEPLEPPDDGTSGGDESATVALVAVAPTSATLGLGTTQRFQATAMDGSGNPLTAVSFGWSATGGSVTADGLFTAGDQAGSYEVVATEASGLADTAEVTITDTTPPPSGLTNECQSPQAGWIWCDDFDQDRLSQYFEYINPGGSSFVREAGVGTEGSYGMRVHFNKDQVEAGALHLAFGRTPGSYFRPVDAGNADYREIFWRMYLKHQSGWGDGGGFKLSRATVFAGSNWSQAMIAHVWSGLSFQGDTNPSRYYLVLDPASGTDQAGNLQTTQYNDFANLRWLGAVVGQTPLFDSGHVGQWYCVEAHVRLNDPGSSNGLFEFWIDDNLEARKTDMNWVGSYTDYGINAVFFENYWNAGSHQTQERFFDNIVVSTQRIGCGG